MTSEPLIYLSDEENRLLVELAKNGPELICHRAQLILAYAEGMPTLPAASQAGISRGRARFWKRQFLARRMAIFELADTNEPSEQEGDERPEAVGGLAEESGIAEIVKGQEDGTVAELPLPQPLPQIGIAISDTLAEAGRKVWLYYFAEMLSHEAGTLIGEDIEELHDMRVATRRMRTAFDVFGPAFDDRIMKRHLKGLRKTGRVLGQVRDMDVILENAVIYQKKLKESQRLGLEPLLVIWKLTIDEQREKLTRHLQSNEYQEFKSNFNRFLQATEPLPSQPDRNEAKNPLIRDGVPALVYSRFAAVRAYESILPTASITQLHALRIEFKKLRYTLEYFKEVLGGNIGEAINEIKELQDHLGALHDADVACLLVRNLLKDWEDTQLSLPIADRQSTEPFVTYLAYLHAERYRLVRTFPELWRKFSQPEFRHILAEAIALL